MYDVNYTSVPLNWSLRLLYFQTMIILIITCEPKCEDRVLSVAWVHFATFFALSHEI